MWKFGKSSLERLATCEPDLQKLAHKALEYSPYDFGILCGIRSPEAQKERLREGKSQTLKSRHLANERGLSEALDFGVYVGGEYINGDTSDEIGIYRKVNQAFFRAAIELGIQIEAGALWRSFVDAGHIQLLEQS